MCDGDFHREWVCGAFFVCTRKIVAEGRFCRGKPRKVKLCEGEPNTSAMTMQPRPGDHHVTSDVAGIRHSR